MPPNPNNTIVGKLYKLALAGMAMLLVLSLVLFKERMFFIDPSFITFEIIQKGTFIFSEHRYGAFITQAVPLLLSKMNLPLNLILLSYSASFYAFYFGVMWVLGIRWKQYLLGVLLFAYCTCFVTDGFFWPNNEIHQGIAWLLLFIGHYKTKIIEAKPQFYQILISAILLTCSISCHLLVVPVIVFLWGFYFLVERGGDELKITHWIYTVIIGVLILVKYNLSLSTYYDKSKLKAIHSGAGSILDTLFQSEQLPSFLSYITTSYWYMIALSVGSFYLLLKAKQYLTALWWIGCSLGYALLIAVTFPNKIESDILFYYESEWMALAILLITPFLYFLKELPYKSLLLSGLLIGFCVTKLLTCKTSYQKFHQRYINLEQLTRSLHDTGKSRVIIEADANAQSWLMDWGLPLESLLLSAYLDLEPHVSFKLKHHVKDSIPLHIFETPFRSIEGHKLNTHYFKMDFEQPYEEVKQSDVNN